MTKRKLFIVEELQLGVEGETSTSRAREKRKREKIWESAMQGHAEDQD